MQKAQPVKAGLF